MGTCDVCCMCNVSGLLWKQSFILAPPAQSATDLLASVALLKMCGMEFCTRLPQHVHVNHFRAITLSSTRTPQRTRMALM